MKLRKIMIIFCILSVSIINLYSGSSILNRVFDAYNRGNFDEALIIIHNTINTPDAKVKAMLFYVKALIYHNLNDYYNWGYMNRDIALERVFLYDHNFDYNGLAKLNEPSQSFKEVFSFTKKISLNFFKKRYKLSSNTFKRFDRYFRKKFSEKLLKKAIEAYREKRYKESYNTAKESVKLFRTKQATNIMKNSFIKLFPDYAQFPELAILSEEEIKKIIKVAKNVYRNEEGNLELELENGIELVYVEGGEFFMGCLHKNLCYDSNATPVHSVWLENFWIGKYEVTFEEFDRYCKETEEYERGFFETSHYPSDEGMGRGRNPVINVKWEEAVKYTKWLKRKTGLKFRLCTEAEWEYAARGGKYSKGYIYSGSNNIDKVGWYYENSNRTLHPVGTKRPNELGIYDMTGNVWEWVRDWYDENYYKKSPYFNPQGPLDGSYKVVRGGAFNSSESLLRLFYRVPLKPSKDVNTLGFRICLSLDE